MSADATYNERRPSWRVLEAMRRELRRQQGSGAIGQLGLLDEYGRVWISGTVDLAILADVTERAIRGMSTGR